MIVVPLDRPERAEAASAAVSAQSPPRSESDVDAARSAGALWKTVPLRRRLAVIRRFRHAMAEDALEVARSVAASQVDVAEVLTAQVIPLLDACRFVERRGAKVLRTRRVGIRRRAVWLWGVTSRVVREPWGVVLILTASNYPLLLPGVQAVQAIAAGNAVVLKPGRGTTAVAEMLRDRLEAAGLPQGVLTVIDEPDGAGGAAIEAGPDFVVLTGSAATGRRVLAACADKLIPATVELSGCDAVFVLPGATDERLQMLAKGLTWGLRLNAGATCIAPRRVLIGHTEAERLIPRLLENLARSAATLAIDPATADTAHRLIADALAAGATCLAGAWGDEERAAAPQPLRDATWPVVLDGVTPGMEVAKADVFAPVLSIIRVGGGGVEALLTADAACPYALGASIWGPLSEATALAERVRAGSVCINDLILPTADPRLTFGGTDESGFGSTRGEEGLLAMTRPRVVSIHRGGFRPHYDPPRPGDAAMFAALAEATHSRNAGRRLRGLFRGVRAMMRRGAQP